MFKTLPDTVVTKDYAKAKDALTTHFEPAKNPIYEISNFRQGTQRADETMDQFHTRLCTLAQQCDFHDTNFEIKLQLLVCNGTSSRLRRTTLRDPNYTLEQWFPTFFLSRHTIELFKYLEHTYHKT